MCFVLRTSISSDRDMINLSRCCLPCPSRSFNLVWEVHTQGHNLDSGVLLRSDWMLIRWHNIKRFVVPPARQKLVYATKPAFW